MAGCFVRLGVGKTKPGGPKCRLSIIRNVDASDADRKYKLEGYEICKYLGVLWDDEDNAERCQMTEVSDSPPLEEEFKDWLQVAERNGVRVPTPQDVLEKREEIQQACNSLYSADTAKTRMLEEMQAAKASNQCCRRECGPLFPSELRVERSARRGRPLGASVPFPAEHAGFLRAAADEQVR